MVWNKFIPAVIVFFALCSCAKNTVDDVLKTRRIGVDLSIETRTTLNAERSKLVWSEGDKIALKNNATEDVAELEYKSGGRIEAEVPAEATSVTALYPFSMASGIEIPKSQTQSEAGVLDSGRYPMSSEGEIAGDCVKLLFKPEAGALALNIYKSTGLSEKDSVRAVRVSMHTVSLSSHYALGKLKPSDKKSFPGQIYLVLPRAQYESPSFEIETTLGLYTISMAAGSGIDLQNNDFYALNIDLSKADFKLGAVLGSSESLVLDSEFELGNGYPKPNDVNIIPDFSSVGYHYGEESIPDVPVGVTLSAPSDSSDATALIQNAVDNCPAGKAVYLNAGTYNIAGTIWIERSNIVLRGAGEDKTMLHATDTALRDLIVVGNVGRTAYGNWPSSDHLSYKYGTPKRTSTVSIVDSLVPCGRWFVTVDNASSFAVGDKIFVIRTPNQDWMDRIGPDGDNQWTISSTTFYYSRVIQKIVENRIYLDAPITFQIEKGNGKLCVRSLAVLSEVGIEYLSISSDYDPTVTSTVKDGSAGKLSPYCADEKKMFNCITIGGSEHCWIRNVTGSQYTQSVVRMDSWSKNISVLNCRGYDPISLCSGQRRYAFHICGELNLVKDCECDKDRHAFVTYAWVEGPNAFVNCTANNNYAELGPHQRMANGVLYDNLSVPNPTSMKYYGRYGVLYASNTATGRSGHGWTGANIVAWNCYVTYHFRIYGQSADGIYNYAVGCVGKKSDADAACGRYGTLASLEDGCWYPETAYGGTNNEYVSLNAVPAAAKAKAWWPQMCGSSYPNPRSLYECQLYDRLIARNLYFCK